MYWWQPNTDGNTTDRENGENEGRLEGLRDLNSIKPHKYKSSQGGKRKAWGLLYLEGALGQRGCRGRGLFRRRNSAFWLQLSHKTAKERQRQPANEVEVKYSEKGREWREGRTGEGRRQGQHGTLNEENVVHKKKKGSMDTWQSNGKNEMAMK